MVINFLHYRDEEWIMQAVERHYNGRTALGAVPDVNDPRAIPMLLHTAAMRDLRGELSRRNTKGDEPF